jgi:hypothetical protein
MKLTKIITAFSAVIVLALLAVSCTKQTGKEVALEQNNFTNKAFVQVYNAVLSSTRNYVYVDGSAVTGAALAYTSTFPSTPSLFVVNAGVRAFLIRIHCLLRCSRLLRLQKTLRPVVIIQFSCMIHRQAQNIKQLRMTLLSRLIRHQEYDLQTFLTRLPLFRLLIFFQLSAMRISFQMFSNQKLQDIFLLHLHPRPLKMTL